MSLHPWKLDIRCKIPVAAASTQHCVVAVQRKCTKSRNINLLHYFSNLQYKAAIKPFDACITISCYIIIYQRAMVGQECVRKLYCRKQFSCRNSNIRIALGGRNTVGKLPQTIRLWLKKKIVFVLINNTQQQTQHTTHNTQHTTHNTQHTTHNKKHTTHNTQHTTHNTQHTTHNT